MSPSVPPFAVNESSFKEIVVFGEAMRIWVMSNQTNGVFSILEQVCAAGQWGWAHRHRFEDHFVQVVSGEMEFIVGVEEYACKPGDSIFIPKMTWHKFRASEAGNAKMLFFNFPGGLEKMFIELAEAEAAGTLAPETELEISQKYGVDISVEDRPAR